MPINKVPVVHKFGILSQSHQAELQRRLLQKTQDSHKAKLQNKVVRNPLEITEEFIQQFKNVEQPKEKESFLDLAWKMLQGCKRKAGLNTSGYGHHVDIPAAWMDLVLLVHCKGRIQEDALDILLVSLDHTPFQTDQIPVLFFIAESVLFWICDDTVQRPYLYSSEVKTLKLGFLVFLRLWVFQLSSHLEHHQESKTHLYPYIQALQMCKGPYQPYPNVLFAVHFMISAGTKICGVHETQHDVEEKEQECTPSGQLQATCYPIDFMTPEEKECEMNQFIWHCLLVWFCVHYNIHQLEEVLLQLQQCKEELHQQNWINATVGLLILGEAAKLNMSCMKGLMDLARDSLTQSHEANYKQIDTSKKASSSWPWELAYVYTTVMADIFLHGDTSEIKKMALVGSSNEATLMTAAWHSQRIGLCQLLQCNVLQMPDCDDISWYIRYSAVHSLVKSCHVLQGNASQEGLRNAAWTALQKHLCKENNHVLQAVQVSEVEINGPTNPFINESVKAPPVLRISAVAQHVGQRIASRLAQFYLPPAIPYIPLPKTQKEKRPAPKIPVLKKHVSKNKATHLSPRDNSFMIDTPYERGPDFNIRTEMDLQRVIEDQWKEELQVILKEEEEILQKELQEKKKKEEEHFKEIMKKREEKLNKKTKPYEL
ncbi:transmembrane protein 232 [Protopterus annectens]|uniref:transmembrane protein 232 n=1 Tax=Protopterus annectens TaxID=7888 RepID=UPI001CFADAC3|nr:transmembrane protein 232 [Protopterus annectens]XP_043920203.1 transmembrane protein 232 [Protopterus annectens]XP_043920204.1 transmembrane protein 232 [Protopterus annectens]